MKHSPIALAAAAMIVAGSALAQGTGPNQGLLGGTGDHKTELLISPNELTVYLIDHGKIAEAKGATLRAVVQYAGKTRTIKLTDGGGSRLVGKLDAPLEKGAVVVVTGTDNHGHRVSARYVIK